MLILIDDADLDKIKKLYEKYPYDGVTTNPTILSKSGNPNPMDQLRKIREMIPESAMLHAQVLSTETKDMIEEAKDIHTVVKAAGYDAEVLGASFKNSQQILEMAKFGIKAVTVNPDTLNMLTFNGIAENAVKDFICDFEGCCGEGKTMMDFQ